MNVIILKMCWLTAQKKNDKTQEQTLVHEKPEFMDQMVSQVRRLPKHCQYTVGRHPEASRHAA